MQLKERRYVAIIVAFALLTMASVLASIWATNKTTAHDRGVLIHTQSLLRSSQLAGCIRAVDDRLDAIRGWTAAYNARQATADNPHLDTQERLDAAKAAATYQDVINGYTHRIVDCYQAYPAIPTSP